MKKIILFSAVACSMAFYACKKDSKTETTPTDESSTSIDPVALSAAVKVGYATSTTGEIPAATTDGPTLLKDGYENRTYYAISNRYVVIYPQSDKGFVAGYYVKINGAQTYFKVDYKAAAGARKLNKSNGFREEGDNSDSSIVIKLPAGLIGDTFSVKYAAFDTLNRVSNTITAIVSVIASADSTDNSLLYGTWRYNRNKSNYEEWGEPQMYKIDTSYEQMSCVNDHLQWCEEGNACEPYAYNIYGYVKNDQTFGANNTYSTVYQYERKYLDMETSSCSDLKYNYQGYSGSDISGYSYNAKTKVLTIIYDGNNTENGSNMYTEQYTVNEITSTKLVFSYKSENDDGRIGARDNNVNIRYYEFLKQ